MVRLTTCRDGQQWVWRSGTGQGAGFEVDGVVSVHAENGRRWVDVQGDLEFHDDRLPPGPLPPVDVDWPATLSPTWPWVDCGTHLLGVAAMRQVLLGRTVVVPNRHLLARGEPAVCSFSRSERLVASTVTLAGRVSGCSAVVRDEVALRAVQSWVQQ